MVVEVKDLVKSFSGAEALKGVSFGCEKGEIVSVIGASGSGKSTLLRCIGALERAESGSIAINGEKLMDGGTYQRENDIRRLCSNVGMVFQQFNLFPHLTVMENITLAPVKLRRIAPEAARARAMELLDSVGLIDKADQYPSALSGGQQQRAAIARALALNPELMLFDEPTSALDPELSGGVLQAIMGLAKTGMTMIIVTHEMSFARDISDRVVFMDSGRMIEEGAPEKLFGAPESDRLKSFLGMGGAQ